MPAFAVAALPIVGFCEEEEKLLGPFHEYTAPEIVVAVSDNVCPEQMGLLFPAVGADGSGLMVTIVVPTELVHPFTVAVIEYVPALFDAALEIAGFCVALEKLLGPFQL